MKKDKVYIISAFAYPSVKYLITIYNIQITQNCVKTRQTLTLYFYIEYRQKDRRKHNNNMKNEGQNSIHLSMTIEKVGNYRESVIKIHVFYIPSDVYTRIKVAYM